LPRDVDRRRLARFVLTVMEGGLMQSRAAGTLEPFDEAVETLREHFRLLASRASAPMRKRKKRVTRASRRRR
jgi:hypothetical protein